MKSNFLPSIARQLTACAATLLIAATTVAAQTEHVIYAFKGGNDGSYPTAGLISDAHGNLYGTTTGSNFGGGTIFQLTKPTGGAWTETVLHTFTGGTTDGRAPEAGLIFDRAGNLYGTTAYGGTSNLGIVFELTPPASGSGPWTETILYNFQSFGRYSNGSVGGGLIFKGKTLYGTTLWGGLHNDGNVYALAPNSSNVWNLKALYSFDGGADGLEPNYACDALVLDKSGNLYGVTAFGGVNGAGNVFEMTPPSAPGGAWTETVLYSFGASSTDGNVPVTGVIFDANGNLYGTTNAGGNFGNGTVYELSPPAAVGGAWTESVIYSFTGGTDGDTPWGNLTLDKSGNLYGTTLTGGVYKLAPPSGSGSWTETTLYHFPGASNDGVEPQAGVLVDPSGNLYGTTSQGGATSNGTVYVIHP
jgi:uncharacterized repeat protein (TIGR03803 family)